MPILTLKVTKEFFRNLEEFSAAKGETPEEFAFNALQDTLNMWEDFSSLDEEDTTFYADEIPSI